MDLDQPLIEWFSGFSLAVVTKVSALFALRRLNIVRQLGQFWNAGEYNQNQIKSDIARVIADVEISLRIVQRIVDAGNFCAVEESAAARDHIKSGIGLFPFMSEKDSNAFPDKQILFEEDPYIVEDDSHVEEERSWMILDSTLNIIEDHPVTTITRKENKFDGKIIDLTFDTDEIFTLSKSFIDWLIRTDNNRPDITDKLLELRIGSLAKLMDTSKAVLESSGMKKLPLKKLLNAVEAEMRLTKPVAVTKQLPSADIADDLLAWLQSHHLLENNDILVPLVSAGFVDLTSLLNAPKEVFESCGMKKVPLKKLLSARGDFKALIPAPPRILPKVDNWECTMCHLHNSSENRRCMVCNNRRACATRERESTIQRRKRRKEKKLAKDRGMPVAAEKVGKAAGSSSTPPRPSWLCNMCKLGNEEKDASCKACFTPRVAKTSPVLAAASSPAPRAASFSAKTASAPPAPAPAAAPTGIVGILPPGLRSLWSGKT